MTAQQRSTPVRALVIDDELDHCEMIEECLSRAGREPIDVRFAHTVEEACRILEKEKFTFILLDHNLPDGHGCDVLDRMDDQLLTTPVIGLSTSADPQVAIADFRGGAIEFIQKHDAFKGDYLRRRIFEILANYRRKITANALERRRQVSAVAQTDEELVAAARTDPLMGIFNRATLRDVHVDLHRRAEETGDSYALCIIDVDHFKTYNDHYGHSAGDDVLQRTAAALRSAIRPEDLIARYGGEELVVLLSGVDGATAEGAAHRLCECVSCLDIPHEHNADYGIVTVSAGVAVFRPGSGESRIQIFQRADRAMYDAKSLGRNRYVVAPPAPNRGGRAA